MLHIVKYSVPGRGHGQIPSCCGPEKQNKQTNKQQRHLYTAAHVQVHGSHDALLVYLLQSASRGSSVRASLLKSRGSASCSSSMQSLPARLPVRENLASVDQESSKGASIKFIHTAHNKVYSNGASIKFIQTECQSLFKRVEEGGDGWRQVETGGDGWKQVGKCGDRWGRVEMGGDRWGQVEVGEDRTSSLTSVPAGLAVVGLLHLVAAPVPGSKIVSLVPIALLPLLHTGEALPW